VPDLATSSSVTHFPPAVMSHMSRKLFIAALAAFPLRTAAAQLPAGTTAPTPQELAARIDSVVKADIFPRGFPSVSVVVTRGGRTLLERAWGVADITTGRKAEPSTVYNIGSMAKQFTAALVLKLAERGKLSLTDPVSRHVKGLPATWSPITIEQLLNHTSGLTRDYVVGGRATENLPGDSLIAIAARDTLESKPGTVHAYSNTGYMLLGNLVEKMYGKPYGAVLREEIARPLGLTSLAWCEDTKDRAATGYIRTSDGKVLPRGEEHTSRALGAAGICSTAGDIAKWNHALHGGRVVSAASYAAMTTPRGAAMGKYGFGLAPRNSYWASPAIVHDGQSTGFSSHNGWYPAESLSVTLLYNALPRLEVQMADFVGMIALGGKPRPIAPMPVINLPVAATQGEGRPKIVGAYEISVGRMFIVSFEDGKLYVTPPAGEKQQLFLLSGTSYKLGSPEGNTTLVFHVDSDGIVTGFTARAPGGDRDLKKVM
jgi:D-alanyl-D-alanine carboxypeptidase